VAPSAEATLIKALFAAAAAMKTLNFIPFLLKLGGQTRKRALLLLFYVSRFTDINDK
jgi:hypothetical protein